jgi:enamine deaminase RidA (YjgF/YER057c/UK114 family)
MRIILLLALAAAACPVVAKEAVIMPDEQKFLDEWGFSSAVVSGDMVYVSGVVAGLRNGETSPEAAFVRAFDRLTATLQASGASWADVVDMTTYHTDVAAQLPLFREVKHRYVKAPFPAWTAIGVSRLLPPNGLVEIKLVARRRPQ